MNPRHRHQRRAIPATFGGPRRSAAHPRDLLTTVLPSLWPDPLLVVASARARPLPAARVSAASNSDAQPPSSMDKDDHHGTHVVELAVACSGAVLDQGPPPQQILAWINLFGCSRTDVVLLLNLYFGSI